MVSLLPALQFGTGFANRFQIVACRKVIESAFSASPYCHDAQKPSVIGSAASELELVAHSRDRRRVTAAGTSRRTAFHRAVELRVCDPGLGIGLFDPDILLLHDNIEIHTHGPFIWHKLQG